MPRYFFHVRDGKMVSPDYEGQTLPDLEAARREAVSAARELIGERLLHGGAVNGREIQIADEKGAILATVPLGEVLARDGQVRSFSDDVTKSAPVAQPSGAEPSGAEPSDADPPNRNPTARKPPAK